MGLSYSEAVRSADVVVVGSGPNGLAAALVLSSAGLRVVVLEAQSRLGGGLADRSDLFVASAVSQGLSSSVVERVGAAGFDWCVSHVPLLASGRFGRFAVSEGVVFPRLCSNDVLFGHVGSGVSGLVFPSVLGSGVLSSEAVSVVEGLFGSGVVSGRVDFSSWLDSFLSPVPHVSLSSGVVSQSRFGLSLLSSAYRVLDRLSDPLERELFAGLLAHGFSSFSRVGSAAPGLVLLGAGLFGSSFGRPVAPFWPVVEGGSGRVVASLVSACVSRGVEFFSSVRFEGPGSLPSGVAVVSTSAPSGVVPVNAVFKMSFLLEGPLCWRDPVLDGASLVHVGGALGSVAAGSSVFSPSVSKSGAGVSGFDPYQALMLVSDPSVVDPSRSVDGFVPVSVYVQVPSGLSESWDPKVLFEVFRSRLEAVSSSFGSSSVVFSSFVSDVELPVLNESMYGGSVVGGDGAGLSLLSRGQSLVSPFRVSEGGGRLVFDGSAWSRPGGGAHGLNGFYAAEALLRRI